MKRILVVDSDSVTSALTAQFLKNYNYEVVVAKTGKEALDLLENPNYDLVLSEIQMDGLGGFDVLKLMNKCFIDIPLVFLTVDDDPMTKLEAEALGAKMLISKKTEYINLPHMLDQYFFPSEDLVY